MSDEKKPRIRVYNKKVVNGGPANGLYFFGFIGALIYYWQNANSFWMVVLGFLKACVWPAFLIFHLFKFLGL